MTTRTPITRLLASLAILLFASTLARSQTNQGQIAGNVLDASGAAVPNAAITAKSDETGSVYNTVSTSAGSYRFPSIALGHYTITTSAKGFREEVSAGLEVRVGTVSSLDIKLTTGGATETVTVAADAPQVETQSSEVGGSVTARQIIDLPLALGGVGAMRSPEAFLFLIPGTAGPGTGNSANGIFISKIGGGQNFGNEILVDGASTVRSENGSSFDEESPSVEAISEFKVTTNTPSAEFGRTTGGIENFVIKSGTNNIHGTVFDIFRNDDLNANNWFANGYKAYYQSRGNAVQEAANNRGSDKQNDYGGSLGGPVAIPHIYNGRDKTFFFFSWEQFRRTLGGPISSTVPTLAERSGDFSDQLGSLKTDNNGNPILNPCDGTKMYNGEIFDPLTTRQSVPGPNGIPCRTAFADATGKLNVIPLSRLDPVSAKILSYFPLPTAPGIGANYTLSTSTPRVETTYTIRIDHSFGSKDKIFGSYSARENTRDNPQNFQLPAPVTPNVQTQDFLTHFGRFGWDHIFTTNVLNHLNLGYNRSNSINGSLESASGINYGPQLGIPNVFAGFPVISTGNYVNLSRNQNDDEIDNGIRTSDSVSWQKGRNSFKFGGDYRYQQFSPLAHGGENGGFNFNQNQTKSTKFGNYQDGTGSGAASFFLGYFDSAGATIPTHLPKWLSSYVAGFIQDDFKASKDLVLNIGVRYDIDQPRKEAHNDTSNFSPTAIDPRSGIPGALIFGNSCNCNTRWADTWYKDIAPRIGFAYSPSSWNGKLSVRGGFSTLYGPLQYNDFGGAMTAGYTIPINQGSDGFSATYKIDNGLNPYSIKPNLDPALYDNGNSAAPVAFSNYIKPYYGRPAEVNQWNLQVQQELAKDLIMTIGYIGSASSHLRSGIENVNNSSPSTFPLGDILNRPFSEYAPVAGTPAPYSSFNTNAAYVQALRPFPQYDFIATDCCLQNVGHSSYEALIASLERRFSQGLNFQASYTWAKSITNADSALPGINGGVNQEQDPSDPKSIKALSIQDIPHTFVVSYIYEFPFGKNKKFLNFQNSFMRAAVSGFQIGAVQRYQSGQPTSFGCANGIPGYQNCIAFSRVPGAPLESNARRNGHINPFRRQILLDQGMNVGSDPNSDSEFNGLTNTGNGAYSQFQGTPAIYDQNNPNNRILRAVQAGNCPTCDNGGFQFGNLPRVTAEVRNYKYINEDFSFIKRTPFGEGKNFILKVELLNGFNRHVFGTPDTQPYDYTFGVPTYTINGPRSMQLTARIEF